MSPQATLTAGPVLYGSSCFGSLVFIHQVDQQQLLYGMVLGAVVWGWEEKEPWKHLYLYNQSRLKGVCKSDDGNTFVIFLLHVIDEEKWFMQKTLVPPALVCRHWSRRHCRFWTSGRTGRRADVHFEAYLYKQTVRYSIGEARPG